MKKILFFILFIFIVIISLISGTVNYQGYLNSTGIVIFKNLDVFNNSATSNTITIGNNVDSTIAIRLPKNATVEYAFMNISSGAKDLLDLTLERQFLLTTAGVYNFMDYNGSHLYISESGADDIFVFIMNGTQVETISGISGEWGVAVSPNTNTVWATFSSASDQILRERGSEGQASISLPPTNPRGIIFNGSHFYLYDGSGALPNVLVYDVNGVQTKNFSITSSNTPMGFCNFGNGCDKTYFYTKSTDDLLIQWNMNISQGAVLGGGEQKKVQLPDVKGVALNDTHMWFINDTGDSILEYSYRLTSLPKNVTLSINGTVFFNHTGTLNSTNTTVDFKDYTQSALSSCTADSLGYCDLIINQSSNENGTLTLDALQINYTFDLSNEVQVFNWWNVSSNIVPHSTQGLAKFYELKTTPGTEINITGFEVDSSSVCFMDGVSTTVDTSLGRNFCNLTTQMSTFSWTNHTIYDGTLWTGSPANQTNGTQSSSGTNQTRYFNVTGYYPNGTLSTDTGSLKIQNVTAEISLTENLLFLNISPTYGLSWYNSSDWVELNTTNRCANETSESNYSAITLGSDIWRACYNDTNGNSEVDYFKVLIPHLSNQQFFAWHEEDNTAPTITFTTPTGTYTSASAIPFNISVTDNVQVVNCSYNITTDAFGLEKANTAINCSNFNGIFNVARGNDDYIFTAIANDTSNNTRVSTQTFTVSISSGNDTGGGGGGGTTFKTSLKEVENLTIEVGYCGDSFCDDTVGEDPFSCPSDCVPDILNLEKMFCTPLFNCGNWNSSFFINSIIFIIMGGFIFFTLKARKVKRL